MSPSTGSGLRIGTLLLVLAAGVLAAGAAVTVDRGLSERGEERLEEIYLIAMAADLRRDREALAAAADSVADQIRAADALLEFFAERESIGTGRFMRLLDQIREPAPVALTSDTWLDLRFTGRGAVIRPPLRDDMVRYYGAAEALDPGWAVEEWSSYEDFLDEHLTRGGWAWFNEVFEPGRDPLEYGPTITALRTAGLESAVRGVRRALVRRRGEVEALRDGCLALLDSIEVILDE
jgi:hypothetical protein